jgi:hypothetical protein
MHPQIDLRIEIPLLLAGLRVERQHAVEGRADEHRSADHDRRRLKLAFGKAVASVGNVAGVHLPGHRQLRDVRFIDLGQRRIAAASGIAAVRGPVRMGIVRGLRF